MKEAAGEANMTVITIILITAIVAIATPLITNVMKNSQRRTCCLSAGATGTSGSGCAGDYDEAAYNECMSDNQNN
nr:hypothetical protein [Bacilli bacterium]